MCPNIARKILEQEQSWGEVRELLFPLGTKVSLWYLGLRISKIKVDRLGRKECHTTWNIRYQSSDREPWRKGHRRLWLFLFCLLMLVEAHHWAGWAPHLPWKYGEMLASHPLHPGSPCQKRGTANGICLWALTGSINHVCDRHPISSISSGWGKRHEQREGLII